MHELRGGQLADRVLGAALGIVEPRLDEALDLGDAVFGAELLQPPLADARRADAGQIVAIPLVGNADAPAAHADDVVIVLVVALHLDAGEVERALHVDVLRGGVIGRRNRVAAIGLVRLHRRGEQVLAIDEHRHERRVIRRVRVAEIGIVVEEGIALLQVRMQLQHRLALKVDAEDVHRQALGRIEQIAVAGQDRARKIARHADDGGARGQDHGVGHLARDRLHAVRHDGELHGIEPARLARLARRLRLRACACHDSLPEFQRGNARRSCAEGKAFRLPHSSSSSGAPKARPEDPQCRVRGTVDSTVDADAAVE